MIGRINAGLGIGNGKPASGSACFLVGVNRARTQPRRARAYQAQYRTAGPARGLDAAVTNSRAVLRGSWAPSPASRSSMPSRLPIPRPAASPALCRFEGPRQRSARRRAAPPPRNPAHRPEGPASPLPSCRMPEWIACSGLAAPTLVALFGSGEPYPVVGGLVALVAQYEDDLVLNVDREAAEHGMGLGRQRGDRVEHELMRDGLAPLDGEAGIVQRQQWRIAMGCGHRTRSEEHTSE